MYCQPQITYVNLSLQIAHDKPGMKETSTTYSSIQLVTNSTANKQKEVSIIFYHIIIIDTFLVQYNCKLPTKIKKNPVQAEWLWQKVHFVKSIF